MTTFRDGWEELAEGAQWLADDLFSRFMGWTALRADLIMAAASYAIKAAWVKHPDSPADAIPHFVSERKLERAPFESAAAHRVRLGEAWDTWTYDAGTRSFASAALTPLGVPEPGPLAPFDASSLTPGSDGTLALPWWMGISCATVGRTAQTSASTLRSGLGANVARAFSRDGSTWGVLVEPGAVNLQGVSDFSAWGDTGDSPTFSPVTGPDGASSATRIEDDDATSGEGASDTNELGILGNHTMSCWVANVSSSYALIRTREIGGIGDLCRVQVDGPTVGWEFIRDTYSGTAATTDCESNVTPAANGTADTGAADFYGYQVEERLYPTSFIDGTRAADVLVALTSVIAPDGYYDLTITYRPHYADTEATTDHTLLYIDADNHLVFRASDATHVWTVNGVAMENRTIEFSRHQELTVQVQHTAEGRQLVVSGATSGNGDPGLQPASAALTDLPGLTYVLGGTSGPEHGADLRVLAPTFTDPGVWIYYESDPDWDGPAPDQWSRWWVVLQEETPWELIYAGDDIVCGETTATCGSTATVDEVAFVRRMLRRLKAGHEVGVDLIIAPKRQVSGVAVCGEGVVCGDEICRWRLGRFAGHPDAVCGGVHPVSPGLEDVCGTIIV